MEQRQNAIPFVVRVRTYRPHALIALITLVMYLLVFRFLIGNATRDVAELMRVHDAPNNEIVFADEPNMGESFYYLKDYAVSGGTSENAVSDVLMLLPDTVYGENSVYFEGTLESGTCAVSANIAARYALEVGDHARVIGTDKSFLVTRVMPAEAGIDEDYLHEGIVILAFDSDLLSKNYMYVTFGTDGDAYRSLQRLVFVEDMAKGCIPALCLYGFAAMAAVIALMIVCESFLFRTRREDYACYVVLGVRRRRLWGRVLAENILKYVLPSIIITAVYAIPYACYKIAYVLPAGFFLAACAILSIAYSQVIIRRLYYVRAN